MSICIDEINAATCFPETKREESVPSEDYRQIRLLERCSIFKSLVFKTLNEENQTVVLKIIEFDYEVKSYEEATIGISACQVSVVTIRLKWCNH